MGDSNILVMQEAPEITWLSTIMLMGGALGIASNVYKFATQPLRRCYQRLRRRQEDSSTPAQQPVPLAESRLNEQAQ